MGIHIEIQQGTLPLPEAIEWVYEDDGDHCNGHPIGVRWNIKLSDMCWLNPPEEDQEAELFMEIPISGVAILKK